MNITLQQQFVNHVPIALSTYSSQLLENAILEMASLPGIGRKTALRLVLHLLRRSNEEVQSFGQSFIKLKEGIQYCRLCHNLSDEGECSICKDQRRDRSLICVVENIRDVMAIESTQQYRGLYHVLGGIISPMEGTGPADLSIDSLEQRLANDSIKEVILALPPTMEGDTTGFYIFKRLKPFHAMVSNIAKGIAVGSELEYTDEITLGRSIISRVPFEQQFSK